MPANDVLRAEVQDAVIGSWRVVDQEQGHGQEQLFTPYGTYSTGGATFTGREEIADALAARVATGTRTSRHVITNWVFGGVSASRAQLDYLITLYAGEGEPPRPMDGQPIAVGDVHDVLVREPGDGPWLIESRRFTPAFLSEAQVSPFLNGGDQARGAREAT